MISMMGRYGRFMDTSLICRNVHECTEMYMKCTDTQQVSVKSYVK